MSMPARRTVPLVGTSRPATIDSRVLLPEPEAPTMATDSRSRNEKWMSSRMVSTPVESLTCLVTCSTSIRDDDGMKDGVLLWLWRRTHCSVIVLAAAAGRRDARVRRRRERQAAR